MISIVLVHCSDGTSRLMQYISYFSYYCINVGRAVRLYIILDEVVFLYRIFRVDAILASICDRASKNQPQNLTMFSSFCIKTLYSVTPLQSKIYILIA